MPLDEVTTISVAAPRRSTWPDLRHERFRPAKQIGVDRKQAQAYIDRYLPVIPACWPTWSVP